MLQMLLENPWFFEKIIIANFCTTCENQTNCQSTLSQLKPLLKVHIYFGFVRFITIEPYSGYVGDIGPPLWPELSAYNFQHIPNVYGFTYAINIKHQKLKMFSYWSQQCIFINLTVGNALQNVHALKDLVLLFN